MHRALTARLLNRALRISENSASSSSVPIFLCPAAGASTRWSRLPILPPSTRSSVYARRLNHTEATIADATAREIVPESTGSLDIPPSTAPLNISPSTESLNIPSSTSSDTIPRRKLPTTCSGCGAFTQTSDPQQLGFFDADSKRVKKWLKPTVFEPKTSTTEEDVVVDQVLKTLDESKLKELGLDPSLLISGTEKEGNVAPKSPPQDKQPVCERCHNLQHYSLSSDTAKVPMFHPTVESLRETIEESPHKYNHIYHVIDAADFPMSLIPRLNVLLGDIPMRTRNRRSRAGKFVKDRKTELSFIITRSDLLGPTKEIVDSMMPYLREVLRDTLGRLGGRIRLGNLSCVSAKRSWWTSDVKEDIWRRGGAGWMVGKVNVGKSQLFEAVYPKGRMGEGKGKETSSTSVETYPRSSLSAESITGEPEMDVEVEDVLDVGELLPPARPATNYPEMPLVSSLPGTTASPIRIPFGNGKGELIDLPGLARSDLELYVKEEHRQSLIMKKRIVPEQISMKPGKSLILGGGLIRITPKDPNMMFLAYNFTPLEEHLTQTEKAIAFQNQERESAGVPSIMLPEIGDKMKHAGTFPLKYDVTKRRAGPLTRKSAVGLQVDNLPFRVLSTDILIEGVGYVELVAQVRAQDVAVPAASQRQPESPVMRRQPTRQRIDSSDPFSALMTERRDSKDTFVVAPPRPIEPPEPKWPAVHVYSPEGQYIDARQPIQGWMNNKPRVRPEHKRSRPRKSMKGEKKKAKAERWANEG